MHMSSAGPGGRPPSLTGGRKMHGPKLMIYPSGWVILCDKFPGQIILSRNYSRSIPLVAVHVSKILQILPPKFIDSETIFGISPTGTKNQFHPLVFPDVSTPSGANR